MRGGFEPPRFLKGHFANHNDPVSYTHLDVYKRQGPRREAITMIFLVIANVPLLYFWNEDWFHTLIFLSLIHIFDILQHGNLRVHALYGLDGKDDGVSVFFKAIDAVSYTHLPTATK